MGCDAAIPVGVATAPAADADGVRRERPRPGLIVPGPADGSMARQTLSRGARRDALAGVRQRPSVRRPPTAANHPPSHRSTALPIDRTVPTARPTGSSRLETRPPGRLSASGRTGPSRRADLNRVLPYLRRPRASLARSDRFRPATAVVFGENRARAVALAPPRFPPRRWNAPDWLLRSQ
jgi:hypothetical protein